MADSPPPMDDIDIMQDEEKPLFADMEKPEEDPAVKEDTEEEEEDPELPEEHAPQPALAATTPLGPTSVPAPTLEPTVVEEESPEPVKKESPNLVESASTKPSDLFADEEDIEPEEKKVCWLLNIQSV